jgi:GH24 family phage-related lysozyme (muramidase)
MAYDFTFNTGNRQSSSRRTGGGRIETGEATIRRRDTPRETPEIRPDLSGVEAMSGLAGALGDFFGVQADQATIAEGKAEKEKNAKAIAAAKVAIEQDREGAREALQTGDYSGFIPEDEVRKRKVVQESFAKMVGIQAGLEDFESNYQEAIAKTPLNGDPRDTLAEALAERLEGASPVYAENYTNSVLAQAEPHIGQWRTARLKAQIISIDATNTDVISKSLAAGDFFSLVHYNTLLDTGASAYPLPPLLARTNMTAILDSSVIRAAKNGNSAAMRLLSVIDPGRDGTSIMSRNKLDPDEIQDSHIASTRELPTLKARVDFSKLDAVISATESGVDGAMSPAQLQVQLLGLLNQHGRGPVSKTQSILTSQEYKDANRRIKALFGKTIARDTTIRNIIEGTMPSDPNKAQTSVTALLDDPTAIPEIVKRMKITPQAAMGRVVEWIASVGIDANGKKAIAIQLLEGNPEQTMQKLRLLRMLSVAGAPVSRFLPDGEQGADALGLYLALDGNRGDEETIMNKWRKANEASGPPGGPPVTYFSHSTLTGELKPRGQGEARAIAEEVYNSVDKGIPLIPFSGSTPRVSDALKLRMIQQINVAANLRRGLPYNREALLEDAKRAYKILGAERVSNGDGDTSVGLNRQPIGIAISGKHGGAKRITPVTVPQMQLLTKTVQRKLGTTGKGYYASTDSATGDDGSLQVFTTTGTPVFFKAGSTSAIENADMEQMFQLMQPGVTFSNNPKDDTSGFVTAPPTPGPDDPKLIMLDENFYLEYDDRMDGWLMRARIEEPGVTSLAALETERKMKADEDRREDDERTANVQARSQANTDFWAKKGRQVSEGAKLVPPLKDGEVRVEELPPLRNPNKEGPGAAAGTLTRGAPTERPGGPLSKIKFPSFVSSAEARETDGGVPDPRPKPVPTPRPKPFTGKNDKAKDGSGEIGAFANAWQEVKDAVAALMDPPAAVELENKNPTPVPEVGKTPEASVTAASRNLYDTGNSIQKGRNSDINNPNGLDYKEILFKEMSEWENSINMAYNDADGYDSSLKWVDSNKKRGNPTIGIGFLLTRRDSREMIGAIGADYDKIMDGTAPPLTPTQIRDLYDRSMKKVSTQLTNRLGSEVMDTLSQGQTMALKSLVFNAGIGESTKTSIIGPILTMALKKGQWGLAEDEIRNHSINKKKMIARGEEHLIRGLQNRRHKEADMFRGWSSNRS